MRKLIFVFGLLVIVFGCCTSCNQFVPDFTRWETKWNSEREKRGITLYSDSMVHGEFHMHEIYGWGHKGEVRLSKEHKPFHQNKSIRVYPDSDSLISESDMFYSGKWRAEPRSEGELFPEYLDITYYYDTVMQRKEMGSLLNLDPGSRWICTMSVYADIPKQITIQQADSVLASWGIDRLKPD